MLHNPKDINLKLQIIGLSNINWEHAQSFNLLLAENSQRVTKEMHYKASVYIEQIHVVLTSALCLKVLLLVVVGL